MSLQYGLLKFISQKISLVLDFLLKVGRQLEMTLQKLWIHTIISYVSTYLSIHFLKKKLSECLVKSSNNSCKCQNIECYSWNMNFCLLFTPSAACSDLGDKKQRGMMAFSFSHLVCFHTYLVHFTMVIFPALDL